MSGTTITTRRTLLTVAVGALVVLCTLLALGMVTDAGVVAQDDESSEVSEERFVEPAPEEGDEYYEAEADDGSWISYINPRDRYRDPMAGNSSGKVCVTLRNEAGEVVVGESVPDTTVTIPTPSLYWHSHADPMVVEFPLTDNYDRPLDSDQFGTSPDLPQGDGYMDSHCIEFHGPADDETIEYGEVQIDGEHADNVEVVGYIQQANEAWDTDVDPFEDAVSYEEAGGEWTNRPNASHGQVVAVLQLQDVDQEADNETEKDTQQEPTEDDSTATETPVETTATNGTATANETTTAANGTANATDQDDDESVLDQSAPGVGVLVLSMVLGLAVARRRQR